MKRTRANARRAAMLVGFCASCAGDGKALLWDDSGLAGNATSAAGAEATSGGAPALPGGGAQEPKGGMAPSVIGGEPARPGNDGGASGAGGSAPSGAGGSAQGGAEDEVEPCPVECCGAPASGGAPTIVADSERGFSGVQGQCGWSYGYYADGTEPFQALTYYGTTDYDAPVWQLSHEKPPWVAVFPRTQHPNLIPLLWVSRRWTSPFAGAVSVRGHVAMTDPNAAGDGVIASVLVAGSEVWHTELAFDDVDGEDFELRVGVDVGSAVDFVVAPGHGDAYDSSLFTVVISRSRN